MLKIAGFWSGNGKVLVGYKISFIVCHFNYHEIRISLFHSSILFGNQSEVLKYESITEIKPHKFFVKVHLIWSLVLA